MKNHTFPHLQKRARPRRRGRTRLFVLSAAFVASAATHPRLAAPAYAQGAAAPSLRASAPRADAAAASAQAAPALRFDVPAGTIGTVTGAFQAVTGFTVTLANDMIRDLPSPGVSGVMTPATALERMLAGTGVGFVFSARDSVTLDLRTSEFVAVAGIRLPEVASPKYTVPLRDIAQTIALIPRVVMEKQGATTLSEALRNVPGITLQAGEGGGSSNTAGDMFNMRGFNASNSLFVDGVRDDGLISRDVFNIEQVEVFMGPTGSDVGRGTAAGYVNMQTKSPHVGTSHAALLGFGSADQKRLSVDTNWAAPSRPDGGWLSKSAIRLNLLWQDSGVPGRDIAALSSKAVAPSITMGLDTATRLTLAAQIVRQDNVPDYGIPGAAWLDAPLASTTVRAPASVDQENYYGSVGYDYDKASQDSYTARVEHDVNRRLSLRNQTRVNTTHRDAVISTIQNVAAYDPATNLVTVARQGNERENKVVSNQTSLVARFGTGRLRHASTFGVEYAFEEQFAPTLTGLGIRAPVNIFAPNPNDVVTGFAPARTAAFNKGRSTTVGFYAFDSVELDTRWQISGGARWEHYETEFRAVDAAGLATANLEGADGLLSGKVSVLFRASEAGNVYVSYGTSVTPPGSANFTLSAQANNQNNPSVKPQESKNYEVGSKWDLGGGRILLTGSVFRTENKNVIFTVDAAAIPPIYNQDDGQIVNGVTAGVMGRLTDRWDVLASLGYLDTRLQTQNAVNNGRRLTLTPKLSSSIWTTYRLSSALTFGGGVRHTDAVWINAANTIQSPGYRLIDALAEYAVNANLSLRLNVYNLTDETYIRNVNNNGGRYNPGHPRSATVTSNVRF